MKIWRASSNRESAMK